MVARKLMQSSRMVEAAHYGSTRLGSKPTNIIIHTAETNEIGGAARAVANYFHTNTIETSAHYCVDNKQVVQCVPLTDRAWAAPPLNTKGIHIELSGRAGQTKSQWNDTYSLDMLDLAAELVAELLIKYNWIPVKQITAEELKVGRAGICGHVDVTKAFHKSTHTDPGINFPWPAFMKGVRGYIAALHS